MSKFTPLSPMDLPLTASICRLSRKIKDARQSHCAMEDKFQLSFQKEGPYRRPHLEEPRRKRAIPRSFRISCLRRVLLSLSTAYPKGITFPLGSCLSGTNSRNSSRLLPAERSSWQFFATESPYRLLARVVPSGVF